MLALLYDVHGNLAALDAVLEDARAAGARRHLIGGDVALFGPWPAETVDATVQRCRAPPDSQAGGCEVTAWTCIASRAHSTRCPTVTP